MKIIDACTCPLGPTAGHDRDECRANLVEDGSIICVICATRYPKMSPNMHQVWKTIVASGYGVPSVQLGSQTQPGTEAYNMSCLCGYDPNLSDMVRAKFNGGKKEHVDLEYEQGNEQELNSPTLSIGRALTHAELARCSERTRGCIAALETLGFRVTSVGTEIGFTVRMMSGRPVGSMGYIIGASIQLHQN